MTERAAMGERNAMLGYSAQYLLAAALMHGRLLDGSLEWIAVADPAAGRVDDLQIATPGALDAYQFKWHEYPPPLTWGELRGNAPGRGLLAQLAAGWASLRAAHPDRRVRVHLSTNSHPSVEDIAAAKAVGRRGVPHHLAAFLAEAWSRQDPWPTPHDDPDAARWSPCLDEVRAASALPPSLDFDEFRRSCEVETGQQLPVAAGGAAAAPAPRIHRDVEDLARLLSNVVGRERSTVRLSRQDLLRRLGWSGRLEFNARHEFPVAAAYQPVEETLAELEAAVARHARGYLSVVGTPGSGKSSLLTATFRYRAGVRVVRYYCFVPDGGGLARGEARSFLEDLTLALWREGVRPARMGPASGLAEARELFGAQLHELHGEYASTGRRTLLLVDGLDHVGREESPERSLVAELPAPDAVPDGVLILLGSQRLDLDGLHQRIGQQLRAEGRTVTMRPLTPRAVRAVVEASALPAPLGPDAHETVGRLSAGHPLALAYLMNRLRGARTTAEAERVLAEAPPYAGTVADEYELYWTRHLESAPGEVRDLLALASRLRGPLRLADAARWVGEEAVRALERSGRHYFAAGAAGEWRFFHNSFRQYVLDRTGRSPFGGAADPARDASHHRRLADLARAAAAASDPFAWEELFHRHHAGDHAAVAAVATQACFRRQFLEGRPARAIREDIGWAMRAASTLADPLLLVRLLLADDELDSRVDVLGEVDLPRLRLALGDPAGAAAAAVHDRELLVGEARGLRLAAALLERGQPGPAREVFDASEPLGLLSGEQKVDRWGMEHIEVLEAWADVAHRFLPMGQVVSAVERLEVDGQRLEERGMDAASLSERMREDLLVALARSVAAEGDVGRCRALAEAVAAARGATFAAGLGRSMDRVWISRHPDAPEADAARDRLLAANAGAPLPEHVRLLVAERVLPGEGGRSAAAALIDGIGQPPSLAVRRGGPMLTDLKPFAVLIRLNRLLAVLGRPVAPEAAVPEARDEDEVPDVLLERMLVRIANVWGAAWRGLRWAPATVWRELLPAVRLQELGASARGRDPLHWSGFRRVAEAYYDVLIRAAAAHGPAALARVGDGIEARWSDPGTAHAWPPGLRRRVATALVEAGDAPERLRRTLEAIEPGLGEGEEAHDRVLGCQAQIEAWAGLGELARARALVPRMLRRSFGIHHDKDTQLEQWVGWFGRTLEATGGICPADAAPFMSGVATAAARRQGHRPDEAAEAAVAAVARWRSPAAANAFRRAFADEGALAFEGGVAALGLAACEEPSAVPAACAVVSHLCLPYAEQVRPDLARGLGRAIGAAESRADAERVIGWLVRAIDVDLAPKLRRGWREALAEGAAGHPHADLFAALGAATPAAEPTATDAEDRGAVTLRDGTVLPAAEVRRRARDKRGARSLLDDVAENRFYAWDEVVRPLVPDLDAEEAAGLAAALRRLGRPAGDTAPLWQRLLDLGRADLAQAEAEASLRAGEPYGWYGRWDGGSRLVPLRFLARLDPSRREDALRRFVADYLGAARNPRDAVRSLDHLADLFWAEVPIREVWLEIEDHVFQLEEFAVSSTPLAPAPAEGGGDRATALISELVAALFEAFRLVLPEVREDAYRALTAVAAQRGCAAAVARGVRALLHGGGEEPLLGLSLLEALPRPPSDLAAELPALLTAVGAARDVAVRGAAARLAARFGATVPPAAPGPPPFAYAAALPSFATGRAPRAAALLAPGTVLPGTADPLELVGAAEPLLHHLASASGVPLRNLVERAVALMHEFGREDPWDPLAERGLQARCRRLDLSTSYRRPRAAAALRAAAAVVTELLDAGLLDGASAAAVAAVLSMRDAALADRSPERRGVAGALCLLAGAGGPSTWTRPEDWVGAADDTARLAWPVLPDRAGGEVVGFDFRGHLPDWDRRREARRGALWADGEPSMSPEDLFEALVSISLLRAAARYPGAAASGPWAGGSAVVGGHPMRVELGRSSWIALDPALAADCGWRPDPAGLFRWVDADGRTMVESVWWRDGRLGRGPYHEDARAEGWAVWASPGAIARLRGRVPAWSRVQAARRTVLQDRPERTEVEAYGSSLSRPHLSAAPP